MKPRRAQFNPKRGLTTPTPAQRSALRTLAEAVRYTGNPEHKRTPGDFNLTPPASPRCGKTLCDEARILKRSIALALLKAGFNKGLVDQRWQGDGWPQLVWAVSDDGIALEAQREGDGVYHGYPMQDIDPLRDVVLSAWRTNWRLPAAGFYGRI